MRLRGGAISHKEDLSTVYFGLMIELKRRIIPIQWRPVEEEFNLIKEEDALCKRARRSQPRPRKWHASGQCRRRNINERLASSSAIRIRRLSSRWYCQLRYSYGSARHPKSAPSPLHLPVAGCSCTCASHRTSPHMSR